MQQAPKKLLSKIQVLCGALSNETYQTNPPSRSHRSETSPEWLGYSMEARLHSIWKHCLYDWIRSYWKIISSH